MHLVAAVTFFTLWMEVCNVEKYLSSTWKVMKPLFNVVCYQQRSVRVFKVFSEYPTIFRKNSILHFVGMTLKFNSFFATKNKQNKQKLQRYDNIYDNIYDNTCSEKSTLSPGPHCRCHLQFPFITSKVPQCGIHVCFTSDVKQRTITYIWEAMRF